ncbi:MAG: helix-turn-helix domain-containing protein [Clostridiales bacterium]|nr:helix-turn-helix domain-containing protein [Clostridiales bacterium]
MTTHMPHQSIGFRYQSNLYLLTLKGIGLQTITSHSYSWDNSSRRDSHCLLQYTVTGEGAITVNHTSYPLKAGDLFLIDIPGNSHYYLPDSSCLWEFLYLEFSKECLPLLNRIYRSLGPVFSILDCPALVQELLQLYELALTDRLNAVFENSKAAYSLWMDLLDHAAGHSLPAASQIDAAKDYIDRNCASPLLNLDAIADHTGLSKFHMSKEFHKKFGISPGRYLSRKRLSLACGLLLENNGYSLSEIAEKTGYANNNYFGKVFKAAMGMTPDQFRRQNTSYDIMKVDYSPEHRLLTPPAPPDK